jgi:peptidoglycan/LPS O-acetylase OafA/YrhL
VLCALLTQKIDRRWLLLWVALGILSVAALRARLHSNQAPWLPLYMGLDTRADELLCGSLAGMLAVWNLLPQSRWFRGLLPWMALAAVAFLTYAGYRIGHLSSELFQGWYTWIAVGTAVFILAMIQAPFRPFQWILESRPLVMTGRVSYGLYLWHFPILVAISPDYSALMTDANRLGVSANVARVAAVALMYLAATVSYFCVEKPFLRLMPSTALRRQ